MSNKPIFRTAGDNSFRIPEGNQDLEEINGDTGRPFYVKAKTSKRYVEPVKEHNRPEKIKEEHQGSWRDNVY